MKGGIGTRTSTCHSRLPHQRRIFGMAGTVDLSKQAKVRPTWLGHYGKHRNAGTTCRRFGISRSALY